MRIVPSGSDVNLFHAIYMLIRQSVLDTVLRVVFVGILLRSRI